jgi:hypothetical protein
MSENRMKKYLVICRATVSGCCAADDDDDPFSGKNKQDRRREKSSCLEEDRMGNAESVGVSSFFSRVFFQLPQNFFPPVSLYFFC